MKKTFISFPVLFVFVLYFVTHIPGLLELPVFADEAIYIRWAQLIIDEPLRYAFFPMNDGKTPLFFWLLVPFQFLFSNQLFAARFVSVIVGFLQLVVVMKIVRFFFKSEKVIALAGLFVTVLPYWFFHHRMALTDGLMTLFVSLTYFQLMKLFFAQKTFDDKQKLSIKILASELKQKKVILHTFLSGLWFSLALYSKVPAVLFIPGLTLTIFFVKGSRVKDYILAFSKGFIAFSISILLFGLLILSPSFSQLFGRGSDFLFPLSEVLAGRWRETLPSVPVYIGYFISYMTPSFLIFSLIGLFSKKYKTAIHVFFWSGILFLLPIAVMGRVVYPRYLFPAVFAFTLSSLLGMTGWYHQFSQLQKQFWIRAIGISFMVVLIANSIGQSSIYILQSVNNHVETPFVSSDVAQYLTEWSSGHGIAEVVDLIRDESQLQSIAIGTEGTFGTLPDGLLLYFHRKPVDNIYIEGIGVPIDDIPPEFAVRAKEHDRKWLVVNADRLQLKLSEELLLKEYCRPFNAPCLQVWDITDKFEEIANIE